MDHSPWGYKELDTLRLNNNNKKARCGGVSLDGHKRSQLRLFRKGPGKVARVKSDSRGKGQGRPARAWTGS